MAVANTISDPAANSAVPQKSKSAFRTIAEVAELLKVEAHVLRFWETKFSKIQPLKMRGGRRYYRPEDIELIKTIKHLLYDKGFTIRGVQKILQRKGGVDALGAEMRLSDVVADHIPAVPENNFATAKIVEPALPVAANISVPAVSEIDIQNRIQAAVSAAIKNAEENNQKALHDKIGDYQTKLNDLQSKLANAESKIKDLQDGIKPLLNELHQTRDLLNKTA